MSAFRDREGRTYNMGVCPGQAPIAIDPFCLLRVKIVPSEENSASCGALAYTSQSVTAIHSAIYAFSSKFSLRQPLKFEVVLKKNSHVRLW